jgi:hypothetical protein
MDKRGNKRQIDFTSMESTYLNLGKNRLISEQAKFTHTNISSHTNFDMPSNKLNKVPSRNNRALATNPRDTKNSLRKCYSCNYLDHLLPDCPTHEKYLKESNRLAISQDCHFDEAFSNIMCKTWRPFYNALALRPIKSLPPKPSSIKEHTHTGDATTLPNPTSTLPTNLNRSMITLTQDTDETQLSGFQVLNLNFTENHTQEGCKPSEDSTAATESDNDSLPDLLGAKNI